MDIANYSKNRIEASKLTSESYVGVDNLLQNKSGKTVSDYVPTKGNFTGYINGDILIGNIRPYLKKIWLATDNGGTNGDVLVVQINKNEKDNILSKYLYYLLSSNTFFDYSMQFAKGAKMPRGDKSAIMKYEIPIPDKVEQERIVSTLDKFESLINDISIGLRAELKARRSQYEYYRSKLLTFNEYVSK
jgi:type I restriction enzyme S subunit